MKSYLKSVCQLARAYQVDGHRLCRSNIVKVVPFVLLLAFVGCDHSRGDAMLRKTSEQVEQWVPMGTSLGAARQAMEQHQFTCSVSSYDTVEQMKAAKPREIGIWNTSVIRDHCSQFVTNVTDMECKQGQLVVLLRLVNGQTMGISTALKTNARIAI